MVPFEYLTCGESSVRATFAYTKAIPQYASFNSEQCERMHEDIIRQ